MLDKNKILILGDIFRFSLITSIFFLCEVLYYMNKYFKFVLRIYIRYIILYILQLWQRLCINIAFISNVLLLISIFNESYCYSLKICHLLERRRGKCSCNSFYLTYYSFLLFLS
ncbi:hypothetical protein H311_02500 [Anncaliia algerae PRA109]|nr:hypothetical protein H311_02500 [Anncaliia algerae PRA109]